MAKKLVSMRVDEADLASIDSKAKAAGKDRTAYLVDLGLGRRAQASMTPQRTAAPRPKPSACEHPVGRRIGTGCGQCGAPDVGKRGK